MEQKTSKAQILDDVVEHIKNQGGRAVNTLGACLYVYGKKLCSHSMALKPEHRNDDFDGYKADDVIDALGDEAHQEKYQGHEPEFWVKVQEFHDVEKNWNKDGSITEKGELRLKKLKERYQKNELHNSSSNLHFSNCVCWVSLLNIFKRFFR